MDTRYSFRAFSTLASAGSSLGTGYMMETTGHWDGSSPAAASPEPAPSADSQLFFYNGPSKGAVAELLLPKREERSG